MNKRLIALSIATTISSTCLMYNVNSVKAIELNSTNNYISIKNQENTYISQEELKPLTYRTQPRVITVSEVKAEIHYNSNNLLETSNVTLYHVKKALENTAMSDLAEYFYNAEKEYGVNVFFLMAIVALESGWNKSDRAKDGSNNITGHAVYSRASRGSTFNSKEHCIMDTAKMLKRDYLTEGGKWFNGYSVEGVNKKYCATSDWTEQVNDIAENDLLGKIKK